MLKTLIDAFRYAKLVNQYVKSADDTEWTQKNATDLAYFLNTDTGKLWMARLRNRVFHAAATATKATKDHGYYCGVARGVAINVSAIQDDYLPALTKQEEPGQEAEMPVNASNLASLLSP